MRVIAENEFSTYENEISVLSSKELKGCWCDVNGNEIEESYWGNTVRFYIADNRENFDRNFLSKINFELSIKTLNAIEKISDFHLRFSSPNNNQYIEIQIKDRWELPDSIKKDKEALLICKISAFFMKEFNSSISISEFKIENGLITDGPNIKSLPRGISLFNKTTFSEDVHAVILHRTAGSTVSSALNAAKSDIVAHLYVDKNGDIFQLVSVLQQGAHVGRIRKKPAEGETPEPSTQAVFDIEKGKSYPDRYPYNIDSIGIEVVGNYNGTTWEAVAIAQAKSTARLTNFLVGYFSLLAANDIYAHETISSKTEGEGQVVYDAISGYLIQ
jgi:hypothetical protein